MKNVITRALEAKKHRLHNFMQSALIVAFALGLLAIPSNLAGKNHALEEAGYQDAYSMGNGKVHFKLLIYAERKHKASGNDYFAGGSGYFKHDGGKVAGSNAYYHHNDEYTTIVWFEADHHKNKNNSEKGRPKNKGWVKFKVESGAIDVTNDYDGIRPRYESDGNWYEIDLKRADNGKLTYFEFDWIMPGNLDEQKVKCYSGITRYRNSENTPWARASFELGTFVGADSLQAPQLMEPIFYSTNSDGASSPGYLAVPFATFQKTISYYTSLKPDKVISNTDQNGMIYVPTQDSVQAGFRANFKVKRTLDEDQTEDLWSNKVHIPAYHKLHDVSISAFRRDSIIEPRYKQLEWKFLTPHEEDIIEGDMFEIQRAYDSDFTDAQTIDILPIDWDSEDSTQVVYQYIDSTQGAWANSNPDAENDWTVYYRVRRASSSIWGWWQHEYAKELNTSAISTLPHPYDVYRDVVEGFEGSSYTLDYNFKNNGLVHLRIALRNANIISGTGTNRTITPLQYIDENQRLMIRKIMKETGDTILIQIPNDSVQAAFDRAKTQTTSTIGSVIVTYTDVANMPCTTYEYEVYVDTTNVTIKSPYSGVDKHLQYKPLSIPGFGKIYTQNAANLSSLHASDGTYPDYVLLTWEPTDGEEGSYTIETSPHYNHPDSLKWTTLATGLTQNFYMDRTADPSVMPRYEYRVTMTYTCNDSTHTDSRTTTGSRSIYGRVSGRIQYEDGTGCNGIQVEAMRTRDSVVVQRVATDETGAYLLDSLLYMGNVEYAIIPTSQTAVFHYNHTSTGYATITMSLDHCVAKNIDFDNISSVRFSGRVLYENSTIPVRDANFLLNGSLIKLASEPYKSDASGNFEFRVPQNSAFTLQVVKEEHTFAGDGFVRMMNETTQKEDSLLTLEKPLDGVRVYDQTKVRLIGRLAGGNDQGQKTLGFGLSTNNLGDDLQLVLELEGDNISQIVHVPSNLSIDSIKAEVPHLVWINNATVSDTAGKTQVLYLKKRIIIRPDINTGEYAVDLFPVKYKITQATAKGYATLYAKGKLSETLDLIDAPLKHETITHEGDIVKANATYSITYHSPINVSCKQLSYGIVELDYLGELNINRQNVLNKQVKVPLAQKQPNGSYTYLFGAPVFNTGSYTFRATAHEDYYYNNDTTSTRHEEVRIHDGELKVYNGLHAAENTQITSYDLNSNGEANFTIPVDYVSFVKTGEQALRVLDLSVEYEGQYIEKQAFKAFIMGNKAKGADFLQTVGADVVLLDILRDPPGSGSSAYIESGTTYKYTYTSDLTCEFGLDLALDWGRSQDATFGSYQGVEAGIYSGYIMELSTVQKFDIPIVTSYYSKRAATYTFTTDERIETSSSPYNVGKEADVYIGATQNMYFGLTDAVKPIDSVTYEAFGACFANGTMKVVQSGTDDQGKKWYLVIGQETEVGSYIESTFAYTYDHIVNTILPKIIRERDALLLTCDSASAAAIATARKKTVYWSKVGPEDENFASKGYYVPIPPAGRDIFVDRIESYNKQFAQWINLIILNERDKFNALYSPNAQNVGTWSVSSGTQVSHNEQYEYGNMYTTRVDYPGFSFNSGQSFNNFIENIIPNWTIWDKNMTGTEALNKILNEKWEELYNKDNNGENTTQKNPQEILTTVPGVKVHFEITPILNLDFSRDPAHGGSQTKKTGFTLVPDAMGYMDVSVFRVAAPDKTQASGDGIDDGRSGFNDGASNTQDFTKADNYQFGSYVYRLNGGASRCPWESADSTVFFTPKVQLSAGTLKLENQKLDIDVHERSDVPADKAAVFNLRLSNEAETNIGGATFPISFLLKQKEGSNPKGAKLYIDGMPLTGDGREIALRSGDIINKTMEVYAGEGYDFENIVLTLMSPCDVYNISECTFSVHYMPVSCEVNISAPHDKWIMNTLSPRDSIGYYLPIVIDGFDVNYKGFDHIELQYKLTTQSDDDWVNQCSFYASDSLFALASGNKAMITGGRIENVRFYGERDPMEQQYDLRAVSFCRHGSGFITRNSAVRTGMKDTRIPALFSFPEPANNILGIGDDIRLRFSEAIAGNYLDEDNNFSLVGVTNETGITASSSVRFDGTESSYATTKVTRTLTNNSFSIDLIARPTAPGEKAVFFSHGDNGLKFGKTADNRLFAVLGSKTYTSKVLDEPMTGFTRVILSYDKDSKQVRFYAGTKNFTDSTQIVPAGYTYSGTAPLIFGRGYKGDMLEARLWLEPISEERIALSHFKHLTGYERNLAAYYPMNESRGDIVKDKANGATLYLNGTEWQNEKGISVHLNSADSILLVGDLLGRSVNADATYMLWFKTKKADGTIFRTQSGIRLTLENDALVLHSKDLSWRIGNHFADDEWHHFVIAVNRTYNDVSIFVDGELTNTFAALSLTGISGTMYLGGGGFEGNLDEFLVFEQALPKSYIEQFDNISPIGDEMGLIGYLAFESQKENQNGIIERVFSINDQRIFKNSDGDVLEQIVPLVLSDSVYNPVAALADMTEYAPVRTKSLLSKLNFSWTFNDNELLLNLKMKDREINKQSIFITVRDVEDQNGNPMASPVTWTAFVDRNGLKWSQRELKATVAYGLYNEATNIIQVNIDNHTGMRHTYTIESLPDWLTCTPQSGAIQPTESQTVRFHYNVELPVGIYSDLVYVTDENGLSEPLRVELTVEAQPPYEDIDVDKYQYNMSLCGEVRLIAENGDTIFDTDERDIVYALYYNQCVGMANIAFDDIANTSEVYITVHGSDKMSDQLIHFQLWQASTGKVFDLASNYKVYFAHGNVYGCEDNKPVLFTMCGSEMMTIELDKGWNWISIPLDMSATKGKLEACMTASDSWMNNDEIKNPSQFLFCRYDTAADGFVGSLQNLHFSQMYMVYTAAGNTIRIYGKNLPEDSMHITIHGDKRWNVMPCLFDQTTPLAEALSGYYDYASAGDIIKAHDRFATFSKNGKWVGDLTTMHPGEGYLFRRVAKGDVTIPFYKQDRSAGVAKTASLKGNCQHSALSSKAATNMTMIATIKANGERLEASGEGLRAYIGEELVGIAQPMYNVQSTMSNGEAIYFLTISSDIAGELRFETEDGIVLQPIEMTTSRHDVINYQADSHHGSLKSPVILVPCEPDKPYKIIENDQVIIIRGGERYTITGIKQK